MPAQEVCYFGVLKSSCAQSACHQSWQSEAQVVLLLQVVFCPAGPLGDRQWRTAAGVLLTLEPSASGLLPEWVMG